MYKRRLLLYKTLKTLYAVKVLPFIETESVFVLLTVILKVSADTVKALRQNTITAAVIMLINLLMFFIKSYPFILKLYMDQQRHTKII